MYLRTSLIVSQLILVIGCAGAPPPAAPKPADTPPPAAATNTAAPAAMDERRTRLKEQALSQGYHMVTRSGETFYCRVSTTVGTHLPANECLNEVSLENRMLNEADNRDNYARSRQCGTSMCAGVTPQGH
jgi:hypothetical protein